MERTVESVLTLLRRLSLHSPKTDPPEKNRDRDLHDTYLAVRKLLVDFPKGRWQVTEHQFLLGPITNTFDGVSFERRTASMLCYAISVSDNEGFWEPVLTLTSNKQKPAMDRIGRKNYTGNRDVAIHDLARLIVLAFETRRNELDAHTAEIESGSRLELRGDTHLPRGSEHDEPLPSTFQTWDAPQPGTDAIREEHSTSQAVAHGSQLIFDYVPIDSYPLYIWSGEQCFHHDLRRCVRRDEMFEARIAAFFDESELRECMQAQTFDGPIWSLTSLSFDRDLDQEKELTFGFSSIQYREALATQEMFYRDKRARDMADKLLREEGAAFYLRLSPPNNVYVNTSVIDSEGKLLALYRGSATHDSHNIWTLGPCETMRRLGASAQQPLPMDELAKKSLKKELGLGEDDYGPVSVSWIGFNCWKPRPEGAGTRELWPTVNVRIQAQVTATLTCDDIWEKSRTRATDVFEHEKFTGLDWNEDTCLDIISSVQLGRPDTGGRRWIQFSALAAQELWRLRHVLT